MTTKSPVAAGMMGQWVKYLLYKHEDLSLGIPRPKEYPSVVGAGTRDWRISEAHRPVCVTVSESSRLSENSVSKYEGEND